MSSVYYLIRSARPAPLGRYDGVAMAIAPTPTKSSRLYRQVAARLWLGGQAADMLGTYALSAGYYDAYYLKAQKVRTLIKQDLTSPSNRSM